MEEKELNLGIVNCVVNSWKLVFKNFWKFFIAFLYPILGIAVGGAFVGLSVGFISKHPQNTIGVVFCSILIIMGFILSLHAFWKYFIRVGATNLVAKYLIIKDEFFEYKESNKIIEAKWKKYVKVVLLSGLIFFAPIFIAFITFTVNLVMVRILSVILIFTAMYLAIALFLCVPFFVFNEELSVVDCIKSSMNLVNKNFFQTIGMLLFYFVTLIPLFILSEIPVLGTVLRFIFDFVSPALGVLISVHWYLKLKNDAVSE